MSLYISVNRHISPQISAVAIDIGGPLRVSDKEMNDAHRMAFSNAGLEYDLRDLEAWQLYGIFASQGYKGFMRAALALTRKGRHLNYFLDCDNILDALQTFVGTYTGASDKPLIDTMAKESENYYNANQSERCQPDVPVALNLLRDNKIPFGVVTQVYTHKAIEWLEKKFPGYFKEGLVSGKSEHVDMDSKHVQLQKMAATLETVPANMLYVADTRGDSEASIKAGNPVALVLNGMGFPQLWQDALPDVEVQDLEIAVRFLLAVKDLHV